MADKIQPLKENAAKGVLKLDFSLMLDTLLQGLNERGRLVIIGRFNLAGKGFRTLEEIGRECGITRERIRQIQVESIKKMKAIIKEHREFDIVIKIADQILRKNGGVMSEEDLLNYFFAEGAMAHINIEGKQIELSPDTLVNRQIMALILNINDKIILGKEKEKIKRFWAINLENSELALSVIDAAKNIFTTKKNLMDLKAIVKEIGEQGLFREKTADGVSVNSYLSISKEISRNPFGMRGLTEWENVNPKGVRGKIYLVLKNNNKPLHFNKITNIINEIIWQDEKLRKFKKIAKRETVHNELIKDKRFVLVGRGTYALKEWGYSPGTVLDVILNIFAREKRSLSREEIVQNVLKERFVKVNTIVFNLHNSGRFEKKGELYQLKSGV